MMRLYGAIQKVEPRDDGTVRVHGIATSEAVDEQGEIVRADAIRAAIPDYMRFPALREMHQLSAAGTTLEAEVCEDGTTRIVAHVVDPVAVVLLDARNRAPDQRSARGSVDPRNLSARPAFPAEHRGRSDGHGGLRARHSGTLCFATPPAPLDPRDDVVERRRSAGLDLGLRAERGRDRLVGGSVLPRRERDGLRNHGAGRAHP